MQAENPASSSQAERAYRCASLAAQECSYHRAGETNGPVVLSPCKVVLSPCKCGAITVHPTRKVVLSPCKGGAITVQVEALLINQPS